MTEASDTCESFLRKSLAQVTFARKLEKVTCESSARHTCKLNNESCRLEVALHGRYCVVILTGRANHSSAFEKENFQFQMCRRLNCFSLLLTILNIQTLQFDNVTPPSFADK